MFITRYEPLINNAIVDSHLHLQNILFTYDLDIIFINGEVLNTDLRLD